MLRLFHNDSVRMFYFFLVVFTVVIVIKLFFLQNSDLIVFKPFISFPFTFALRAQVWPPSGVNNSLAIMAHVSFLLCISLEAHLTRNIGVFYKIWSVLRKYLSEVFL